MASNRVLRVGPVALTVTLTTNIINPATATGGTNAPSNGQYFILRHIRIVNKTASAATASLWLGATAGNVAGTEIIAQGTSVPANSAIDWYGVLRMDTTDFLVGGSGTATALSLMAEGEVGVAG